MDDEISRREWAEQTVELLNGLPDPQATAVRLHYFHGLPYSEIARWLNIGRRDVETAIAHGLRRLGEMLLGGQIVD